MIKRPRKSKTERNRRSTETRDNDFENIENDIFNLGIGVETSALEQSVMLAKIQQDLLPKYESLRSGITHTEGNRSTKRQLEERLDENIKDLKNIENDLKKHNYTNLSEFQKRVCELEYYYTHYEQVRQIITLGGRTSNIHSIIDSKEDARRARRYERSDARYQQSMNAILHNAALTSLWNDDMERYEEYLEAVVNGQVEPSSHPFYQAHCQSFRMIEHTNPSLYRTLAPSGKGRVQYVVHVTGGVGGSTSSSRRISGQPESFATKIGKGIGEIAESIIPSVERDPRQRQAWEQAGSLLALGGAIIMGAKLIKNVFSSQKDNPKKREKAAGRGLGLLALTNIDKLFNWVQNITGWHPSEKIEATTTLFQKYGFSNKDAIRQSEMHIGAPAATMLALHFIPIYELSSKRIIEHKNNEFIFNYDNYERYVNTCNWTDEQKNIALTAGQKLRDDNSINLGLLALGVTDQNKLSSLAGSNRSKTLAECEQVQTSWENCVEWVSSGVNAELFKKGLKAKDLESAKQVINEYNQNGGDTLKDEDKNKLIIKWMKKGLLEVNDPDIDYKIENMLNNPDIDLENMTIKGFKSGTNEIKFSSYKELFNTAYLTEKIKYKFNGAQANSYEPFKVNYLGQLRFDDKNWYEFFNNDTKIISRKTFINDFPTLKENKNYYTAYLNERRQAENAADVSSLDIVSKLGINFYSEKEARELDAKLKQIKHELRYYKPTRYGNPFEIRDLNSAMMIQFTTIGQSKINPGPWNISGLKTLYTESNKEILLKYLNDPTNKMWGSST